MKPQATSRWLMGATAALAMLGASVQVFADDQAAAASDPMAHHGMPGREGGWQHRDHHEHMAFLLDAVDATDAQRAQLKQIHEAAHKDMMAQHESAKKLHEQIGELLAAPTVDAAAIEKVRQQLQALHEAQSKRMTQSLIDAAKVLNPAQRAKMHSLIKKQHERMAEHVHGREAQHEAH
ncbi:MAG: Spy/CpxP family protein refolding chaperone [Burkholderiaceae bacterium]|nr:Spy/CpxP family protein refolding chaperone [Roseateles sp.]MBV8471506.1 Spy/CpxP family protein refolding chaperone [Burkholderiaceae bacterium]